MKRLQPMQRAVAPIRDSQQTLSQLQVRMAPYFTINHAVRGRLPGPFCKLPTPTSGEGAFSWKRALKASSSNNTPSQSTSSPPPAPQSPFPTPASRLLNDAFSSNPAHPTRQETMTPTPNHRSTSLLGSSNRRVPPSHHVHNRRADNSDGSEPDTGGIGDDDIAVSREYALSNDLRQGKVSNLLLQSLHNQRSSECDP